MHAQAVVTQELRDKKAQKKFAEQEAKAAEAAPAAEPEAAAAPAPEPVAAAAPAPAPAKEAGAISAKDVKALREATGAGMMDCKNALKESAGDMDLSLIHI